MKKRHSGKQAANISIPNNYIPASALGNLTFSVFLFSVILYANSIFNGYNMDDELVTINHRLTSKGVSAIPEIFTSPYYQDNQGYAYEYRPIVLATFAIEHSLFGDNAHVSHFVNVLLYALCCILLLKVLQGLFKEYSQVVAFAITILFITHASHTEVVSSIKNRDEILALIFGLLTIHFAIKGANGNRLGYLALATLFYITALLSKATIISFAILAPLALLIFLPTSTSYFFSLVGCLAIATYLIINASSGFHRFITVILLVVVNAGLYVMFNYKIVLAKIQWLWLKIYNQVEKDKNPHNHETKEYNLHNFLSGLIPDKSILSPLPIMVTLTLALGYILLVYLGGTVWSIAPMLLLLLFFWFGNSKMNWWATFAIELCLTLHMYFVQSGTIMIYNDTAEFQGTRFFSIYFSYVLLFGNRSLLFPRALFFLLNGVIEVDNLFENIVTLPLIYLFRYKWLRLAAFVLFISFSINDLLTIGYIDDWHRVVFLMVIADHQFNKYRNYTSRILLILVIIIFQVPLWLSSKNVMGKTKHALTTAASRVEGAANNVNPSVIDKQDRPLHYVEVPLNLTDHPSIRIGTSMGVLFHYLKKVILPYPLAFYYGYKFIQPHKVTDVVPIISLVLHAILFFTAVYTKRNYPIISYGLFVYLLSIATFSNYIQYIPGMVADRYLFVPSIGWCMVFVGILHKISGVNKVKNVTWPSIKPAAKYSFLSILLLYSLLTISRNTYWKDDLTLFRHDIKYVDESAQAHNLLGLHLMQYASKETNVTTQQQLANEALTHFKRAIEIYPPFFNVAYDIGRIYSLLNKPDSAIIAFENALAIDNTTLPNLHLQLSELYLNKGNKQKAIEHTERYINVKKNDYSGYSRLSYIYFTDRKYAESIEVNKRAIASIPNLIDPYINVAYTFREIKNTDSALHYLRLAEKIDPRNSNVQQGIKELLR